MRLIAGCNFELIPDIAVIEPACSGKRPSVGLVVDVAAVDSSRRERREFSAGLVVDLAALIVVGV